MAEDKQKTNEDIESLARDRFKQALDSESDNRERSIEGIRFVDLDEQWGQQDLNNRIGRPSLVINKCAGVVRQISNDERMLKPRIKVRPADSAATPEMAEIFNGLIKNIENMSDADSAYDMGGDQAIKGGWGYWRVITDYADDEAFEQDIIIKRIVNQFSVYMDPGAKEADKSDARWCFITETITEKEFKAKYPDVPTTGFAEQGAGEGNADWFTDNGVRVAEYYYKEPVTKTLWMTLTVGPDGDDYDTIEADPEIEIVETDGKRYFMTEVVAEKQEGVPTPEAPAEPRYTVTEIIKERTVKTDQLMWGKLAGGEFIEGPEEQVGKYIPVPFCAGDESWIEGEPIYKSAFFHAIDSQRLYNWSRSNSAETQALSPRQPYVGTEAMFEGHEEEWDNAHRNPKMRITANMDGGMLPQRQPLSLPDNGSLQESMQAADDIKATTGLYDASLGNRGNETSGVAINARKQQSNVSTFHFQDNQQRAIKFTAKILVDLIPKIYDTERVVRIIGKDNATAWVEINKRVPDPNSPKGYRVINDLSVGKFDVVVDTGPGFLTQRQEAADDMSKFMTAAPAATPVLLPRIATMLDWQDGEEIAEELKEVFGQGDEEGQQQAMQQQQQIMDEQRQMVNDKFMLEMKKGQQELQKGQQDMQAAQIDMAKTAAEVEGQRIENQQAQIDMRESVTKTQEDIEMIKNALGKFIGAK
jgi:hypothetical protein